MNSKVYRRILKSLFVLIVGGGVIGILHEYDVLVALILSVVLIYKFRQESKINPSSYKTKLLFFGMLIQLTLGMSIELWGVSNDYWAYHDLSNGRIIPIWLPIAWANTFVYFYRLERELFQNVPDLTIRSKMTILLAIYAVLPAFGEMITINLGVWTYFIGYQLFGVPLVAILALTGVHLLAFLAFRSVLKKLQISDPVFVA